MMRKPLLYALLLLGLLVAVAAKGLLVRVAPARAAPTVGEFDADRAHARLVRILGDERPHPTDTVASDAVRSRLVAEIRAIGLTPVVRDQVACNELYKQRGVTCARVRNIVATLGPPSGKALLLSAHYDSSVAGPGAGDAGVGVASLLEVAAILRDRRLKRPVIFLFNEGEELGLVGARAFLADPLSRNVDSLINLEARGMRGPANMFETSVPNAPAVKAFARAVERPVANSLATDIYRLMPNYTDVNTFAERSWTTLNLAIIGNETRYHSAGDNLAALDRSSLQHMGDQTLALARLLSSQSPAAGGSRIFMDLAGRQLIVLPTALGLTLLEFLLLAFAWISWRRGGLGRGLATTVLALALATALAWAAQWLLGALRPGMFWRAYPLWTHLAVYATALLGSVAALRSVGERLTRRELRPAFWLTFLLIGTLLALVAPGGAIYFLFPPLLLLAGIIGKRFWRPAERVAGVAAVLLLFLTWGAMLALLEELLNQGPMWLFAPLGALLFLPALIEAKALVSGLRKGLAVGLAGIAALAGWTAAAAAPAYSADRKQQFTIEHVTDADNRKAQWSVLNDFAPLPRAFPGEWRNAKLPHSPRRRWLAAAPVVARSAAPSIQLVRKVELPQGARRVTLRLRPNGAESIALVAAKDSAIRAAGTAGFIRPVGRGARSGQYVLRCYGRSCDGLLMDVIIARTGPVEAFLVASRAGLPPSGAPLVAARPTDAQPQYVPDNTTIFRRVRL